MFLGKTHYADTPITELSNLPVVGAQSDETLHDVSCWCGRQTIQVEANRRDLTLKPSLAVNILPNCLNNPIFNIQSEVIRLVGNVENVMLRAVPSFKDNCSAMSASLLFV